MYDLTIRELKHTQVLVFEHNEVDVGGLLRLLADHCDASGCTLLGVTFSNGDEDEYYERLVATTECPWEA